MGITLKGSQLTLSNAYSASIAGLSDGDLVAAWQAGATNPNAQAQLFHGDGSVETLPFIVALTSGSNDSLIEERVAALPNGNFVVTWVDSLVQNNNTFSTILAQIYDPGGNKVGGTITVLPQLQATIGNQDVSALANGGFVCDFYLNNNVYTQSFQANGAKIGGQVNTMLAAPAFSRIAGLTNGNYVLLTGNFDGFEIFDLNGNRIVGDTSPGNAVNGDVAALPNGRFVVVYDSLVVGAATVNAQIYNADGTTFGGTIAVNYGVANPYPTYGSPHVSSMPDSRFVVSWAGTGDVNKPSTEARIYNSNGTPASTVFVVPSSAETNQVNDITALTNTSFAVEWQASSSSFHGQVLSVTPPFIVNDDFFATVSSNALWENDTGQAVIWQLNGPIVAGTGSVGNPGATWHVKGRVISMAMGVPTSSGRMTAARSLSGR
jgi:hypothetical protein